MNIIPGNTQYLGKRSNQQDSFWISKIEDKAFVRHGGVLAIVADGMGGLAQGALASETATASFSTSYLRKPRKQTIRTSLDKAVEACNQAVYARSIKIGQRGNFGTTLVAAAIAPEGLYWISVGDSRLYLFRKGELIQVTQDNNIKGNYLTSYIGDQHIHEIDRNLRPFKLENGDWLLLCSDGLHGFITEKAIANELYGNPQAAAERLIYHVKVQDHPRQDNTTVVILAYESGETLNNSRKKWGIPPFLRKNFTVKIALLVGFLASLTYAIYYAFSWYVRIEPPTVQELALPESTTTIPPPSASER